MKYLYAWTERFERIVERPSLDDAAQAARFEVAHKPGAVLLSVEEIECQKQPES